MINILRLGTSLMAVFVLGCSPANQDGTQERERLSIVPMVGTVDEIRITNQKIEQTEGGGSSTGGAVVGGLIGGTTGAIIGSTMGSGNSTTTIKDFPAGCRIVVTMDDSNKVVFVAVNEWDKDEFLVPCSLLRQGDENHFEKILSSDTSKASQYQWRVENSRTPLKGVLLRKRSLSKTDST